MTGLVLPWWHKQFSCCDVDRFAWRLPVCGAVTTKTSYGPVFSCTSSRRSCNKQTHKKRFKYYSTVYSKPIWFSFICGIQNVKFWRIYRLFFPMQLQWMELSSFKMLCKSTKKVSIWLHNKPSSHIIVSGCETYQI